jgi:hypothetical protein
VPTTPPTTAPAIAPALDLFWFEDEEPSGAAEAVDDGCIVETAFGVLSGESLRLSDRRQG